MPEHTTQELLDECLSRAAWYRGCEAQASPKGDVKETLRIESEFYAAVSVRLAMLIKMENKPQ